jgi:hypothetical protein
VLETSTVDIGMCWKLPLWILECGENFHCGYWNVLEMSTVPVDIHMLENSVSPVVWFCDIHYICRNFVSVLVTVYPHQKQFPEVIYDLNFLVSFTISVISQKSIIEEHIKKKKFIRHYSRNLNIFRFI